MTLTGPLDPAALDKAKALPIAVLDAADDAADLWIERLYGHWSVEVWGWNEIYDPVQRTGFYNWIIDKVNGVWQIVKSAPSRGNCGDYPLPDGYAAHTWKRNDHALGIAINALSSYPDGREATPQDFGPQPLEQPALELFCALLARLCVDYTIDPAGVMPNDNPRPAEPTFWTHAEAAIADKYFPGDGDPDARWDMARLEPSAAPLSKDEASATGALLRARISEYYNALAGTIS